MPQNKVVCENIFFVLDYQCVTKAVMWYFLGETRWIK